MTRRRRLRAGLLGAAAATWAAAFVVTGSTWCAVAAVAATVAAVLTVLAGRS